MEYGIMILLKLSFVTSIMALIILGIRFCLRKAPKVYTYILWIFVFIRAVLPISYSSAYSLWNMLKHIFTPQNSEALVSYTAAEPAFTPITGTALPNTVLPISTAQTTPAAAPVSQMPDLWVLTAILWFTGIAVMLLYSLRSIRKLRKTVKYSTLAPARHIPLNCRVYESDQIKTAFILGFFRPVIYLPKGLTADRKRLILEHESVHIRRHDHKIKIAAWLILSLHWFNPLMWVSFWFLNKDMELSCDEQVLINLGSQIRADYSSLLLDLATPNRISSGIPLAFSEGNTKTRIKNILNYRPIKFGSAAAAILLIFVTIYGCMGNPQKTPEPVVQTPETEAQTADSSEMVFVQSFVDHLINAQAEDIYAMLSADLKKEADRYSTTFGISLHEPNKHRRMNPFVPTDPPVIEKTATGYHYQMRRPEYPPPPEYEAYHYSDIWEGYLTLNNTNDGYEIKEWTENIKNEIASRDEFDRNYEYYTFFIDAKIELDWLEAHPEETSELFYYNRANSKPEDILTERFHLTDGKVTDIQKDDKQHVQKVTYSWDDGFVVFRMEQLLDGIWYVTGIEN